MGFLKFARTPLAGIAALILLAASVPGIAAESVYAQPPDQTLQPNITQTVTQSGIYTNTWAIRVADGADVYSLAASAGLEVVMPIGSLKGYYLVRAANVTSRAENITLSLRSLPGILYAEQQVTLERSTRDPQDDPLYPNQWHLDNTGQTGGTIGADANIIAAWDAGYTGEGVVVASVDDGVWVEHPDLAPNVRLDLSYDFINNDPDPSNGGHGSAVAGVMAAADNGVPTIEDYCGVGAAYNAEIAGLYMLGTGTTDAVEGSSLSFKPDNIHISNNSWGPIDDGSTLAAPGMLAAAALQNGAFHGRNGLGTIYTWAAGNGGTSDNINADGYANSIYVIAVGASTNQEERSYYSEPGSAMLINAPSNGGSRGITTTGGSTGCTNGFGGTSSAAPLAAGVIALILEANPDLTYRDVMHILVNTADVIDNTDTGWQTNGAGKQFSHYYGFGRIDAGEAVTTAATWTPVTAQTFYSSAVETVSAPIPETAAAPVTDVINVPENIMAEHVQIVFDADHASRGQVHIDLTSPDGTVSNMIFGRPDSGDNYQNWTMMTVANWGEVATGDWTISVYDRNDDDFTGTFNSWQLIVWGTGGTQQLATPTELPSQTPYWTETATSTSEVTSTTAVTPTATATATEAPGTQLLANVSFELKDGDAKPVLGAWTVVNPTGEKIKCNKDTDDDGDVDKFFSNTGDCAFRFKGQVGENSKLRQEPDLTGLSFAGGDMLTLSAFIQTNGTPTAILKVQVKYSDGTEKTKQKLDIVGSDVYIQLSVPAILASGAVENIRVSIDHKATSGKLYVDDVTLNLLPMGGTATATSTPDGSATPGATPDLTGTAIATETGTPGLLPLP